VTRTAGNIEPVIYFVNHRDPAHPPGYLMLAPYSDFPTPEGYERCGADTLREVDRLQARLIEQERRQWESELERDEAQFQAKSDEVRDRLYARMTSISTPEFEKEFIRLYLSLRIDKRERHRQRWMERTAYLHAREMDLHGRDPASEEYRGTMDVKS
jgi:hypothetical protein